MIYSYITTNEHGRFLALEHPTADADKPLRIKIDVTHIQLSNTLKAQVMIAKALRLLDPDCPVDEAADSVVALNEYRKPCLVK
jgi:hypothetical protein